ncbi:hypothetical protein FSARC_13872 [Fusarium sarcochroum]|uniref:BTB domain-containing protein n=1 Tax=Fusarium sarcochroum TaxID=1208366 RepID=A0A8H4SYH9_9HYPO|nr:hypothetical protein FSARC_13872 [Fusarium sarcochroum]
MKTSLLVLAPKGDTELVLRRPNPHNGNKSDKEDPADHFAPEQKSGGEAETEITAIEETHDDSSSAPKLCNESNKDETTIDSSQQKSDGDSGIETTALEEFHDQSPAIHKLEDLRDVPPSTKDAQPIEVRFRVSSAHLMLASPMFKAMLDGPFSESTRNSQGLYEIKAFDWGAEALLILLDVIHGHHRSTPKTVSLEVLLEIAVLVDYYQCHEIIEPFAEMWIATFGEKTWEDYDDSCMPWLFISWVFGQEKFFNHMVATCIKFSKGPLRTHVPLPSTILDKLESRRQSLITLVLDNMYGLLESLWATNDDCSLNCSCIFLGSLMKQMRQHGFEIPRPKGQHALGKNVMGLRRFMADLNSPIWHEKVPPYHRFELHECSFKNKTQPWRDDMARTFMDGVRYENFKATTQSKLEDIPSREETPPEAQ